MVRRGPTEKLFVCTGKVCSEAYQAQGIIDRLKYETKERKNLTIDTCPCMGQCKKGPNIKQIKNGQEVIHNKQTPIIALKLI